MLGSDALAYKGRRRNISTSGVGGWGIVIADAYRSSQFVNECERTLNVELSATQKCIVISFLLKVQPHRRTYLLVSELRSEKYRKAFERDNQCAHCNSSLIGDRGKYTVYISIQLIRLLLLIINLVIVDLLCSTLAN